MAEVGDSYTIVRPEEFRRHSQVGDLTVMALGPAGGDGQLTAVHLPRGTCVEFERLPFDAAVHTEADGPTLFVPLAVPEWGQLNGRDWVDERGVLVAPAGTELLGSHPAGWPVVVVKLNASTLDEVTADLGLESRFPDKRTPVRLSTAGPAALSVMERFAAAAFRPEVVGSASFEAEVAEFVALGLDGEQEPQAGRDQSRARSFSVMADADSFGEEQRWRGVSVSAVCRAIGASETRLRRAFRDVVYCSPKRFLTLRALNAARAVLVESSPATTTVSEVAVEFGFWHFGRFSRDYRELFGELPSVTLRS
ncbi:MAG: helix-turn-helix domain-containing protein [Thermoleophilia bacterium]|nr:helix-turn-helix domain-containing protein [Thermoleophilia bacterium]